MIKELFLAIILGALLGFGITGGFFAFQKTKGTSANINTTPTSVVSSTDNTQNNQQPTPTVAVGNFADSNLTVSTPKDNAIVSNSKITLTGSAPANSVIVITTLSKTYNTISNASGDFTASIELDSGINQIHITSIDSSDNQTESQLSITYSTAKI